MCHLPGLQDDRTYPPFGGDTVSINTQSTTVSKDVYSKSKSLESDVNSFTDEDTAPLL